MKDVSSVTTVFFDVDQVFFDWRTMKYAALDAAIKVLLDDGLLSSERELKKRIIEIYDQCDPKGGEDRYENLFEDLLKENLGYVDPKLLAKAKIAYQKTEELHVAPFPDIIPTLDELQQKEYRIGIITDSPANKVWPRLIGMGIDPYFKSDDVITFENTGKKKETVVPYRYALHKFGVRPEESAMVGDSPGSDIEPANKSKMVTILVKRAQVYPVRYYAVDQRPDYEVETVGEIPRVLSKWQVSLDLYTQFTPQR